MHIGKRSKAWHRSSSQYHYEVRIKKQNQRGRLRRSSQRGWKEVRICPMLETKLRKGLKEEEAIDWVNVTDRPNEMIRKWSLNLITWRLLGSWKSKVVLVKWLKRTSTWASLTQRKRTGDIEDRQHFQRVLTGKVGQQNGTVATRERGVHGEVSLFFRLRIMNDLVNRGKKKELMKQERKRELLVPCPFLSEKEWAQGAGWGTDRAGDLGHSWPVKAARWKLQGGDTQWQRWWVFADGLRLHRENWNKGIRWKWGWGKGDKQVWAKRKGVKLQYGIVGRVSEEGMCLQEASRGHLGSHTLRDTNPRF